MYKKMEMEEVRSRFKEAGMIVISDEYKGAKETLKVRCNNGHSFGYTIEKLKSAKCCIYCRREGMIK